MRIRGKQVRLDDTVDAILVIEKILKKFTSIENTILE